MFEKNWLDIWHFHKRLDGARWPLSLSVSAGADTDRFIISAESPLSTSICALLCRGGCERMRIPTSRSVPNVLANFASRALSRSRVWSGREERERMPRNKRRPRRMWKSMGANTVRQTLCSTLGCADEFCDLLRVLDCQRMT